MKALGPSPLITSLKHSEELADVKYLQLHTMELTGGWSLCGQRLDSRGKYQQGVCVCRCVCKESCRPH